MDETPAGFAQEPGPKGEKAPAGAWRADALSKPSKGRLQAIAFALLLGFAGLIAGVILWAKPTPEPVIEVNVIHEYGPFRPVLPYARSDAAALADLFGPNGKVALDEQQADLFRNWLSRFRNPVSPRETLIVVINGFAVLRPEGVALLTPPPNRDVFDPGIPTVPLSEILAEMNAAQARNILLVLDLSHPIGDLCHGILHDEIAAPLHDALMAAKADGTLRVPVLVSCRPGQWSQACDVAKSTAFGFYLREGLHGAADGAMTGKPDQKVTADELARFVQSRVHEWSGSVARTRQTPMLFAPNGAALDFPVAAAKPFESEDRYSAYDRKYPEKLKKAWEQRTLELRREHPAGWSRMTAALLRAEQVWLRTDDIERAMLEWEYVQKDVTRRPAGSPPPNAEDDATKGVRLPTGPVDEAARKELGDALATYVSEKLKLSTKTEDLDAGRKALAAWKSLVEKPGAESFKTHAVAARLIWERAIRMKPSIGRNANLTWAALRDAVREVRLEGQYAEMHLIDCVGRDFEVAIERPQPSEGPEPPKLRFQPLEAISELLRGEQAAAELLALPPAGFVTVQNEVRLGTEARIRGMKRFLSAASEIEIEEAVIELRRGADYFVSAGIALKNRQEALQKLDDLLAALLNTALAAVQSKELSFTTWKDAAVRASELQAALKVATPGNDLAAIAKTADAARAALTALFAAEAAVDLAKSPRADAKATAKLRHLLEGAALPAVARPAVWDAWLQDQKKFHEDARRRDRAADEAHQKLDEVQHESVLLADEIARNRAEASMRLLALAGRRCSLSVEGIGNLKTLSDWQKFGAVLREDWLRPPEGEQWLRVVPFEASGMCESVRPSSLPAAEDAARQRYWMAREMAELRSLWKCDGVAAAFVTKITQNTRKLTLPTSPGESK